MPNQDNKDPYTD